MTAVSYPGVYVEELPGGARPIEAAGTSTAAFVGVAERGPDDAALRVSSWEEFQKTYGGFIPTSFLAEAVFTFFNNGGRQCYVVRVTPSDAARASVVVQNRATPVVGQAVRFSADNKGAWGNSLLLTIENATSDTDGFKLTVRKQAKSDDDVTNFLDLPLLETFDNLVMDPDSANYAVKVLARDSMFVEMENLAANTSLQRGFHRSGDLTGLTVAPLAATTKFLVNVDDDGYQEVTLDAASTTLAGVATDIQAKVRALTRKKTSTPADAFTAFECTVDTNQLVLTSGT